MEYLSTEQEFINGKFQDKQAIFIGGSLDGQLKSVGGFMLADWQDAGYIQCNGYLDGQLMLLHKDFINKYKGK